MESLIGLLRDYVFEILHWVVFISPAQQGLRIRAGKHLTLLTAGAWLRIPYLDKTFKVGDRLRIVNCPIQTIGGVTVSATVAYEIDDLLKLYMTLTHAEDTIQNLVMYHVAKCIEQWPTQPEHGLTLTAAKLGESATKAMPFGRYGLKRNGEVHIIEFTRARCYRLMQQNTNDGYGSALDIEGEAFE
jgi:hypothetical protein